MGFPRCKGPRDYRDKNEHETSCHFGAMGGLLLVMGSPAIQPLQAPERAEPTLSQHIFCPPPGSCPGCPRSRAHPIKWNTLLWVSPAVRRQSRLRKPRLVPHSLAGPPSQQQAQRLQVSETRPETHSRPGAFNEERFLSNCSSVPYLLLFLPSWPKGHASN